MPVLILGIAAVVLFVMGIVLLFQGYQTSPEASQVVPQEKFDALVKELQTTKELEESLKLQLDKIAVEYEETKTNLANAEKDGTATAPIQAQVQEYQSKVQQLEKELTFIRQKADQQAQESLSAIQKLRAEKGGDPDILEDLRKEKESFQGQLNGNLEKISQLETELTCAKSGSEEVKQAKQAVETLSAENQALKEGLTQITSKISHVEEEFRGIQRKIAEDFAVAEQVNDRLQKEIDGLTRQKDDNAKRIQELDTNLAQTKAQSGELKRLKDTNAFLLEKEKRLQLEFTKSRARALGLEKICEEFKIQLDQQA
jgi:predicted RNase H-like nuclease (RuvC/YqgF family)